MEIDELRGRFEAPPQAEIARLRNQQLDRELRWEGYAAQDDAQFSGLIDHATATNRCTAAARGGAP